MNIPPTKTVPPLVVWYGHSTFYLGVLCFPLALILGAGTYLTDGGDALSSLMTVVEAWGIAAGVCGFGVVVSRGVREALAGLLVIIVFGCGLVGFLFTLGRNPELGHYLWAAGGVVSLPLVVILAAYWRRLPRG